MPSSSRLHDGDSEIESKNSRKVRELIAKKFESFADEVSIIGVRYMAGRNSTFKEKIMWLLLLIFGFLFAAIQIKDQTLYFLQFQTTSNVGVNNNFEIHFPQVTFCNENKLKKSSASAAGFSSVLSLMFPQIPIPFLQTPNLTVFDKWTHEMLLNLEKNLASSLSENVILALWKGESMNKSELKSIYTDMGSCFTFNSGDTNLTSLEAGVSEGLILILNASQSDYLVTGSLSLNAGFRVAIHDQDEIPRMHDLSQLVSPGFTSALAVSQNRLKQLPYPYGDCKDTPGYTKTACYIECKSRYVVDQCGCRNAYMPGTSPQCDIIQAYKCSLKAEKKFLVDGLPLCQCPTQCQFTYYDVTASHSIHSDIALTFLENFLRISADALRSDLVIVQIYFSTMQSVTIEENPAYTIMALLSDIGGALGLLLGATLLTIVEVAQFALSLVVDVIRMRRATSDKARKESNHTSSVTTITVVEATETRCDDEI